MVLQDAFDAAQRFLDEMIRPANKAEIVISKCDELDDAWSFGYNSRAFLEAGDISSALAGNGPVIVPKSGADPFIGSVWIVVTRGNGSTPKTRVRGSRVVIEVLVGPTAHHRRPTAWRGGQSGRRVEGEDDAQRSKALLAVVADRSARYSNEPRSSV